MPSIKPRFLKYLLRFYIGRKGFVSILGLICGLMINVITIPFYRRACDEGALMQMSEDAKSQYLPQLGGIELHKDEYEPRIVTRDPDEVALRVSYIIVKPKQAGTCGRSTKHHPQCQISIYMQFSL